MTHFFTLSSILFLAQQESVTRQAASLALQQASVAVQHASVRRQIKMAPAAPGNFFVTLDPGQTAPEYDCEPLPIMRQRSLTDSAAKRHGVSRELLEAVIQQESAFRPCSVSTAGAMGLMQLMPATADQFGVRDAFDPDQNVEAGATLLQQLLSKYSGDLNRVLAAYNAGPANVDAAGGIPKFPETMKYVGGILERLNRKN